VLPEIADSLGETHVPFLCCFVRCFEPIMLLVMAIWVLPRLLALGLVPVASRAADVLVGC